MRTRMLTLATLARLSFVALTLLALPAFAREKQVYFSVSTSKSFRTNEKPKVQLYAHDVDVLEFRVYRVQDPVAFFSKLNDVHEFGPRRNYSPREQVDERTALERFHDWKMSVWRWIRNFFRSQYSADARAEIRERHSEKARRIAIRGTAAFADVPVLNSQQLVARWRLELPPKYVSESSDLPIDSLPAGAYVVEATDGTYRAYTVLLVSEMALITKSGNGRLLAFTAGRDKGQPISGAVVTVWRHKQVARFTTDAQGLGETAIASAAEQSEDAAEDGEAAGDYGSEWVLAQHGNDVALVASYGLNLSSNPERDWTGYVYTDRPVYRPGDTVHFKAIVRKQQGERLLLPSDRTVEVTVQDAGNNTLLKKTYTLSEFGSVNGELQLPATAALGYTNVRLDKGSISGDFQIEEYKKPEYFVKVTPETARVLQGESMKATIEARYYFGEPVAGAKVKYVVHTQRSYYFGGEEEDQPDASPTAGGGDEGAPDDSRYFFGEQVLEEEGALDQNGRLVVTIPTRVEDKYKIDTDYRVEARVTDPAGREIAGHNAFLATYGTFHLNVTGDSYVYQQNAEANFTAQAMDYDRHPVAGAAVHVEMVKYRYGKEEETLTALEVKTGTDGAARFALPMKQAGEFTIRVTAPAGPRSVTSSTWVWVPGANEQTWEEGEARNVQLVADKASYEVGDTAHVAISGTTAGQTILLTTEGNVILSKQLLRATGTSVMVDIPITTGSQPNINIAAVFVWNNQLYTGAKMLKVPPVERRLSIEITPAKPQFTPGEAAVYNIVAKDWQGKPVQAEMSVGVVDDAIYAVEPDRSGDIVNAFYGQQYSSVSTQSSLEFFFHGEAGKRPIYLAHKSSNHRALAQVKAGDLVQPKVRKAFPDTAFWQADVRTDAAGHATAKLQFPDSLTTWRTTVRAITRDTRGGWAVNRVIVRKNLMVRLAAPRFFRAGDQVVVSAIVHNYLADEKTVRVSLETTGVDIVEGATRDIQAPSRGEVKVDWRLRATPRATSAKLLAKALTNEESDAMELSLPVVPFGVKQSINAAGAISEASAQRAADINFPTGIDETSRSIDLELSPSVLSAIFGSLDYLTSFPYGCTEQTMSSFLPDVVVSNALRDLQVKSAIEPALLKKQVHAGLERLYDFQHEDGGWGWWKEDDSMVFMTAYVVSGLEMAQQVDESSDKTRIDRGKAFLHAQLKQHPNMIADLRAYVVYALALAGDRDRSDLDSVWQRKEKLTAEGVAFAGLTAQLEGDSRANEAAQMLRSTVKAEGDGAYWEAKSDNLLGFEFASDASAETTAYAVKLLTQRSPDDPLLPRAVLWLVRHRDEGYYWTSTKQTAMVIYGVTDYLKASKELNPSFTAEVVVNGKTVLTHRFTAADVVGVVPLKMHLDPVIVGGTNKIEVRKSGAGRLYWSARGTYYSADRKLYQSGTMTLNIARDYYKLVKNAGAEKITYDLAPLSGPVQGGDVLAVRITVSGGNWKYLLMEDPIPAGTEFIERDDLYEVNHKPSWWRSWWSRREFHDDRAAIFQTEFSQQREYFYLLKVVNPGEFQVSPASVQPMYQPEVLATTPPATLSVKPEVK